MRNHGWQPPFHPLQTVAIAVFCTLAFSFYVFFAPFLGTRTLKFLIIGLFTPLVGAVSILYIACTWINPVDPLVHRSQEKYSPQKEAEAGPEEGSDEQAGEQKNRSQLDSREQGNDPTGCKPLRRCQRQPEELDSEEELLYCSICDADISAHSKHCRACDKCVHGFDHHCRWLNNCVGTRNYKPFVALMVSCLLMLIMEWAVGIVVLVRCFSYQTSFNQEISDQLGRSFPRVAFITVLMILMLLALLATAPLTQLFCFHLILMHKGISTYDYILAVRDENQEFWEDNGGSSSLTTSPATSTETGFSGYNSTASKRLVFCTPPRMFVDQDQTIIPLSDLEVGASKVGAGKIIDGKASKNSKAQVGLYPWKLARVTTEDANRAAARARAKSSILHTSRPDGATETKLGPAHQEVDTDSSGAGEIRLAGRKKPPGLQMWSRNKQESGASHLDSDKTVTNPNSFLESLPAESRSPYRSSNNAYSGDPRASFPIPTYRRFPGDAAGLTSVPESSAADAVRVSVNSDGYEASCGESGDDTSDAVGLSQSWNKSPWSKLAEPEHYKEQNVNPWVANFPAGTSHPDAVRSPGGRSVSSLSRVEANILKAKPELQHARLQSSSSRSTVHEDSSLRESSDFLSEDTTTSYGETQDRSTMSSFFITGAEAVSIRASERQGVSHRMSVNSIIAARSALSRVTDGRKLPIDTP